jgi:hypothetical protein
VSRHDEIYKSVTISHGSLGINVTGARPACFRFQPSVFPATHLWAQADAPAAKRGPSSQYTKPDPFDRHTASTNHTNCTCGKERGYEFCVKKRLQSRCSAESSILALSRRPTTPLRSQSIGKPKPHARRLSCIELDSILSRSLAHTVLKELDEVTRRSESGHFGDLRNWIGRFHQQSFRPIEAHQLNFL